jgi:hypothetical protein
LRQTRRELGDIGGFSRALDVCARVARERPVGDVVGDRIYFVTIDTVGMCSVILDTPGTELSAGKESIGAAEGYGSMEDAKAALAEMKDEKKCEGVVVGG